MDASPVWFRSEYGQRKSKRNALHSLKVRGSRPSAHCLYVLDLVVAFGLSGSSVFDRYDKVGAAKLAVATGLGSDTPPGFQPTFAGAVPDRTGGPALVPTQPLVVLAGFCH
jgi:hypothetical protein